MLLYTFSYFFLIIESTWLISVLVSLLLFIITQRDWSLPYSPLEFRLLPLLCRLFESPSVMIPDLSSTCALLLSELSDIIFSLASWSTSCTLSVGTLCGPTFILSSLVLAADILANLQCKDYTVCVLSLNMNSGKRFKLELNVKWSWAIRRNIRSLLAKTHSEKVYKSEPFPKKPGVLC